MSRTLFLLLLPLVHSFHFLTPFRSPHTRFYSSTSSPNNIKLPKDDANKFNVGLNKAAGLLTVTVSASDSVDRPAGTPYLDSKDSDYFVDDLEFDVSRDGGLGLELLELAGGRDDGLGITIIENGKIGRGAKQRAGNATANGEITLTRTSVHPSS